MISVFYVEPNPRIRCVLCGEHGLFGFARAQDSAGNLRVVFMCDECGDVYLTIDDVCKKHHRPVDDNSGKIADTDLVMMRYTEGIWASREEIARANLSHLVHGEYRPLNFLRS
jgi:hypothetical protein